MASTPQPHLAPSNSNYCTRFYVCAQALCEPRAYVPMKQCDSAAAQQQRRSGMRMHSRRALRQARTLSTPDLLQAEAAAAAAAAAAGGGARLLFGSLSLDGGVAAEAAAAAVASAYPYGAGAAAAGEPLAPATQ
jgi:hypothetical protein